jgi:hypothetical protein
MFGSSARPEDRQTGNWGHNKRGTRLSWEFSVRVQWTQLLILPSPSFHRLVIM